MARRRKTKRKARRRKRVIHRKARPRQRRKVEAIITAVAHNGHGGWGPGVRVVRYEGDDGSWAWIPGPWNVGDIIAL